MPILHAICECCNTEPPPPPPPPGCPNVCGGLGQVGYLIVGVGFTPCQPRVCQSVVGAPCPTFGSESESFPAVSLGSHVVPSFGCPGPPAPQCDYFKGLMATPDAAPYYGWGGACAGMDNSNPNHTCGPSPGSPACAVVAPAVSPRFVAFITASYGGLGGGLGVSVWDVIVRTGTAQCPFGNVCGTCSNYNSTLIGAVSFQGAEMTAFCGGATITRNFTQANPCKPTGPLPCEDPAFGAFPGRIYTGLATISVTRGS